MHSGFPCHGVSILLKLTFSCVFAVSKQSVHVAGRITSATIRLAVFPALHRVLLLPALCCFVLVGETLRIGIGFSWMYQIAVSV